LVSNHPIDANSTGLRGKIQISPSTADLLRGAGKSSWIRQREDIVDAKGLGKIRTFWLDIEGRNVVVETRQEQFQNPSVETIKTVSPVPNATIRDRCDRLVDWMTELLSDYMKKVVSISLQTYHLTMAM
jgi:hypothetical protein